MENLKLDGVSCEAKHVNGLVQYYAERGETGKIMNLLKKMARKDVWTYNYLFKGIMKRWESNN